MAILVDSNIIIYSLLEEFRDLRELLVRDDCYVSEISRVEVLGYHNLKSTHKRYFSDVFDYVPIIIPNHVIFNKAIEIRQQYKLKLGDSLIAATALVHNLELFTHNIKDFKLIKAINCVDPMVG